jgi:hypothetical protein
MRPPPSRPRDSSGKGGAELSRRGEKVVGYRPLSEMSEPSASGAPRGAVDAASFEDLPRKWQAA